MPCYSPLHAYEGKLQANGKRPTVWQERDSDGGARRDFCCSQCVGCRLERSRQWAGRCMDEASLYHCNCFITLTYDDEHLPGNRSLDHRVFQLFMKKLRKRFGANIRFYMAGEYGDKFRRPHYHALLFNHDFPDKELFTVRNGNRLYTSAELQALWPNGFSSVGDVSFDSAAYVARYVMKKITGEKAVDHYVDHDTGELLKPEYSVMSKGRKAIGTGGIGKGWYDKFKGDVFPSDEYVVRGVISRPPRYYDNLFQLEDDGEFDLLKARRRAKAVYSDSERLAVKERCKLAQIKSLVRPLEVR